MRSRLSAHDVMGGALETRQDVGVLDLRFHVLGWLVGGLKKWMNG